MKSEKLPIKQIDDAEYGEILKQAVVEIRTACNSIAKQVNSATNSVY